MEVENLTEKQNMNLLDHALGAGMVMVNRRLIKNIGITKAVILSCIIKDIQDKTQGLELDLLTDEENELYDKKIEKYEIKELTENLRLTTHALFKTLDKLADLKIISYENLFDDYLYVKMNFVEFHNLIKNLD